MDVWFHCRCLSSAWPQCSCITLGGECQRCPYAALIILAFFAIMPCDHRYSSPAVQGEARWLWVYGILVGAVIVMSLTRASMFFEATLRASTRIHDIMVSGEGIVCTQAVRGGTYMGACDQIVLSIVVRQCKGRHAGCICTYIIHSLQMPVADFLRVIQHIVSLAVHTPACDHVAECGFFCQCVSGQHSAAGSTCLFPYQSCWKGSQPLLKRPGAWHCATYKQHECKAPWHLDVCLLPSSKASGPMVACSVATALQFFQGLVIDVHHVVVLCCSCPCCQCLDS